MTIAYNPLDKLNLGKSVAEALLEKPAIPLRDVREFEGAGVYALYYRGPNPLYSALSARNETDANWPIYVGKAIPSGGRKGASIEGEVRGTALYSRLAKHRSSVSDVERYSYSLSVDDFSVRYLVVDDIWIPLGESLIISKFRPLWNVLLEGFGNNDPGAGRYNGARPLWDHIHPGRGWAFKCVERPETQDDVAMRIAAYFEAHPLI